MCQRTTLQKMTEGSTFGIVPYVKPSATGAVSGAVGAGGNIGAVCWGLIFRSSDAPVQVLSFLFLLLL